MDELEFIVKGALMMCDKGAAPDLFKPTYNTSTHVEGVLAATNKDGTPIDNIPSFMMCQITEEICIPKTAPMTFKDVCPVKANGIETLLGRSTCPCKDGGTVEFLTSGQIPLSEMPEEIQNEVANMKKEAQRQLNDAGYGDTVGEAGFWEGFIPVWGSGKDAVNDFQQGRWGWGTVNSLFVVFDVCTLGLGSLVKGGLKGGIKSGIKKLAKSAFKNLGKNSFKYLTKENLEKVLKNLIKTKLKKPATWCFVAGTPIHLEKGLKSIENIQLGDIVKSYDLEQDRVVYKKVLTLYENEVDGILEIVTDNETIKTTESHPFLVENGFKDAGQLNAGDELLTIKGDLVKVMAVNSVKEQIKVYNFEVEDSHCYFVGENGFLVLNICDEGLKRILKDIPNKLLNGDKVIIEKFSNKTPAMGGMKKPGFRDPKTGWRISKDIDSHKGGAWKLFDNKGNRIATIDKIGNVVDK